MKHLSSFAFLVVCSLLASSHSVAQTFSGFYLETLDQPYVPLVEGTALTSENWDYNEGWDDPEFLVSIGFDFDFAGTVISDMVQVEQGSTFFASQDGYDYGYDAAVFYLLGEIDLADVGLTELIQSVRQPFNGTPQENLDNKCSRSIMPMQVCTKRCFPMA